MLAISLSLRFFRLKRQERTIYSMHTTHTNRTRKCNFVHRLTYHLYSLRIIDSTFFPLLGEKLSKYHLTRTNTSNTQNTLVRADESYHKGITTKTNDIVSQAECIERTKKTLCLCISVQLGRSSTSMVFQHIFSMSWIIRLFC